MTDSSEEEMEELLSELPVKRLFTPPYLKPQPRTESFNKFVLDEVVIARAMMKSRNIPLSCLSERQRQRALKLREGIGTKASLGDQLSISSRNTTNNETKAEGWGPAAKSIVSPYTKVVAGQRINREEGAKISERDRSVKANNQKKEVTVDFDLEGWSVPPIASEMSPFRMANQLNPFGGNSKPANTEKESKKLTRVSESGRRRHGRPTTPRAIALRSRFHHSPENAADKAHAISSKTIEDSVFPSAVLKCKQGDNNRLLQTGSVWNSSDFSLTSIEASIADVKSGTPSGSGSSIEGVNGGAVEKVATKSGVDSDVHKPPPVSEKTEGSVFLPPLQYSPASPFRKKYPTATKSLISEFADGLMARQRLLEEVTGGPTKRPAEEIECVHSKHQQLRAHQNSSSPYLAKYPSLMEGPRLNWKTVLEDAGKLDGYKLMYANKKKREEMEVKMLQEGGYLQRHVKTTTHRKFTTTDDPRRHSVDIVPGMPGASGAHHSTASPHRVPRPVEIILEKEAQNQFPFVHYDKRPTTFSSISEWPTTGVLHRGSPVHVRHKMKMQTPLHYNQLQLSIPKEEAEDNTSAKLAGNSRNQDTLLDDQKNVS